MEKHENQALIVQSSTGEDLAISSFHKYQVSQNKAVLVNKTLLKNLTCY